MFNKPRIPGFTIFHDRNTRWGWRQTRPGPDGNKHEVRGYASRAEAFAAALQMRRRVTAQERLVSGAVA